MPITQNILCNLQVEFNTEDLIVETNTGGTINVFINGGEMIINSEVCCSYLNNF